MDVEAVEPGREPLHGRPYQDLARLLTELDDPQLIPAGVPEDRPSTLIVRTRLDACLCRSQKGPAEDRHRGEPEDHPGPSYSSVHVPPFPRHSAGTGVRRPFAVRRSSPGRRWTVGTPNPTLLAELLRLT